MNQTAEPANRVKRFGLYVLGVALVVIGVVAFGVVAFMAAWDSAWGSTTSPNEAGPFVIGGLGSWTAAFFAIHKGRSLRPKSSAQSASQANRSYVG